MTFQEYLEDLGYNTRAYSGRGMYGRSCLAVTVDDEPLTVAWDIARSASEDEQELLPANICWDNMGRSSVVYWPQVEFSEGDAGEESQVSA